MNIPECIKILVVGGGPAGSTAATLLARAGYPVALLEASRFPRYHIGESLLPSILQIVDLLGAREKMDSFGFQRKNGAFLEWGEETWPLNFGELSGSNTYAFQVVREDFDRFMLALEAEGAHFDALEDLHPLASRASARSRLPGWSKPRITAPTAARV